MAGDDSGLSLCLRSLTAPRTLAVLSSAQVSWHEVSNSSSLSSAKGLLPHLLLLAQIPSCTRPSCKPSVELAWLKNDLLKTPLEKLCWFLHHIQSVVGITVHVRQQFVWAERQEEMGKRRGGHQRLGLVLPPNTSSHKATKSGFNF